MNTNRRNRRTQLFAFAIMLLALAGAMVGQHRPAWWWGSAMAVSIIVVVFAVRTPQSKV
jgi:hypothetical protein